MNEKLKYNLFTVAIVSYTLTSSYGKTVLNKGNFFANY